MSGKEADQSTRQRATGSEGTESGFFLATLSRLRPERKTRVFAALLRGGDDRSRTGVAGFADPCLSHSATSPRLRQTRCHETLERRVRRGRKNMERMKGFEPSTFCMASRRSSQLSYIRPVPRGRWIIDYRSARCNVAPPSLHRLLLRHAFGKLRRRRWSPSVGSGFLQCQTAAGGRWSEPRAQQEPGPRGYYSGAPAAASSNAWLTSRSACAFFSLGTCSMVKRRKSFSLFFASS